MAPPVYTAFIVRFLEISFAFPYGYRMEPSTQQRRTDQARRIKGLMGENDTSRVKLAAAIGISHDTLSGRLKGSSPFNADELWAIAEFFDVPIITLWPGTERRSPNTVQEQDLTEREAELLAVA